MDLRATINYVRNSWAEAAPKLMQGDKQIPFSMPSDESILDCATRIYISNKISSEKAEKEEVRETEDSDQPKATDKQIAYLIQLGYEGDTDNLRIKEAKTLIQDFKEKKRRI